MTHLCPSAFIRRCTVPRRRGASISWNLGGRYARGRVSFPNQVAYARAADNRRQKIAQPRNVLRAV